MEIIKRVAYINHIIRYMDKGMMIALTGQRRAGKNYLLRLLVKDIQDRNPDANIIYINSNFCHRLANPMA